MDKNSTVIADLEKKIEIEDTNIIIVEDNEDTKQSTILDLKKSFSGDYKEPSENTFYSSERIERYVDTFKRELSTFASYIDLQSVKRRVEDIIASSGDSKDSELVDARDGESTLSDRLQRDINYADNTYVKKIRRVIEGTNISTGNSGYINIYIDQNQGDTTNISFISKNILNTAINVNTDQVVYDNSGFEYTQKSREELGISLKLGSSEKVHYMWSKHTVEAKISDYELSYEEGHSGSYTNPDSRAIYKTLEYDKQTGEITLSDPYINSSKTIYNWSKSEINSYYSDYKTVIEEGEKNVYGESYGIPESRRIYKNMNFDEKTGKITLDTPYVNPAYVTHIWNKYKAVTNYSNYKMVYETGKSGTQVSPSSRVIYKNLTFDEKTGTIKLDTPYETPGITTYIWSKNELIATPKNYQSVSTSKQIYLDNIDTRRMTIYRNMIFNSITGKFSLIDPCIMKYTTHRWQQCNANINYGSKYGNIENATQDISNVQHRKLYKNISHDKSTGKITLSDPCVLIANQDQHVWNKFNIVTEYNKYYKNSKYIGYEYAKYDETIENISGLKLYTSGAIVDDTNDIKVENLLYEYKYGKYSLKSNSDSKYTTRINETYKVKKNTTSTSGTELFERVIYKKLNFNESTGEITLSEPYNDGNPVPIDTVKSNYSEYPYYYGDRLDGSTYNSVYQYTSISVKTSVLKTYTIEYQKIISYFDRKGTFIEDIITTSTDKYTDYGEYDGYWYERDLDYSTSSLSANQVVKYYENSPYFNFSDFGLGLGSGKLISASVSSGGKLIISYYKLMATSSSRSVLKGNIQYDDVTSFNRNQYPDDGTSDNEYWYTYKETVNGIQTSIISPENIEEQYQNYPYYYNNLGDGTGNDTSVYQITAWKVEGTNVNYSHRTVYTEQVYNEGDFINYVTSTNESAYPNNGYQDGYWYKYYDKSTYETSELELSVVANQYLYKYCYGFTLNDNPENTIYKITSLTLDNDRYKCVAEEITAEVSEYSYSKGSYIEDVTSSSSTTFPSDNKQNGYWYTTKGSSSTQPSTTSSADTVKNKWQEYPYFYEDLSSGNSNNRVYKITKWEEASGTTGITYNWNSEKAVVKGNTIYYTRGEYIESVSSLESGEYPNDGYSNGYWYVKDTSVTSEETTLSGAKAIANQYTEYPYYYGDLNDGTTNNTVYKILSWGETTDKYLWASNKILSTGNTIVYTEGAYIGDVNSELKNQYPDNGIKGNYWYKTKENTTIAQTIISNPDVISQKYTEYPYYYGDLNNGTYNHNVYKITSWEATTNSNDNPCYNWFSDKVISYLRAEYVKGVYLEDVTSEYMTDYPTNGIKNGYWYVKLDSVTHIIDSVIANKGKYYFFANISYDNSFKDTGSIKLIIKNSKDTSAYAEFTYNQTDKFEFEALKSFDEIIIEFNNSNFVYDSMVKYRNIMLTQDDYANDTYVAYNNKIITLKNRNYLLNQYNDNYDITCDNVIRVEYYDNNINMESLHNDITELQSVILDKRDTCGLIENYGDYLFFDNAVCENPTSCRLSYDNDKFMRNGTPSLKCTFEEDVDLNPVFSLQMNKYIQNINSVSLVFYIDKTVSYDFEDNDPITIHLCSDSYNEPEMVNYLTTTISKSEIIQGWNIIKKNTASFTTTGYPNAHAIKYVVIEISQNRNLDNKDIYLNSIIFNQEMKPTVLLAFDGIYEEGIEYAYPYLTTRGIPATILANDRTTFGDNTLNAIVDLRVNHGWDIGQYGCNPNKELLTKDDNPREQYLALKNSREWLKDNLIYNPVSYSAPYGNLRPISVPLLKDLGYRIAKVSSTGYCNFFDSEYDFGIPMVLMSNNTTETEIIQKLQYAINNKCAICIYTNNVTSYGDEQSAKKTLLESVINFILKNKNKITPMTFSEFYEKCKK